MPAIRPDDRQGKDESAKARETMHSFDWNLLAAGSAGVGIGLVALFAFSRRKARRLAALTTVGAENRSRPRIDVVAIDEDARRASNREAKS